MREGPPKKFARAPLVRKGHHPPSLCKRRLTTILYSLGVWFFRGKKLNYAAFPTYTLGSLLKMFLKQNYAKGLQLDDFISFLLYDQIPRKP